MAAQPVVGASADLATGFVRRPAENRQSQSGAGQSCPLTVIAGEWTLQIMPSLHSSPKKYVARHASGRIDHTYNTAFNPAVLRIASDIQFKVSTSHTKIPS